MIVIALVWIIGGGLVIGLSLVFLNNEGMAGNLFSSLLEAFGRLSQATPPKRSSSHP